MKQITLVLRLLFGAVFIWSGIAKLKDPISFAESVRNFQIIGDPIAPALALFIPWVEIIAGIAVMIGKGLRGGAGILLASLIVFTAAIGVAWARGLDISCGCFGGSGAVNYPLKISQNFLLLAMGFVVWKFSGERNGTSTSETGGEEL